MDAHGDKHGYLRKAGAIPQQRCAVSTKHIAVKGSTRGLGALGAHPESKTGMGKTAKLEGNESAKYEKLEKRSLRSLKGGGTEKELRAGHNSFKDVAMFGASGGLSSLFGGGDSGPSKAELRAQKMKKNVRAVAKAGGPANVDAAKNPVFAAKVARRQAVTATKQSGDKTNLKDVRQAGGAAVKAAKQERKGFTRAEKKESAKAYHETVKSAKKTNRMNRAQR